MEFTVGNVYTFNTLAPALLGASIKNAKVLGVVGYAIASTFVNIDIQQRAIYPLLPAGVVDNPKNYQYLILETESGTKTAIAVEWIDLSSVQVVNTTVAVITIPDINTADLNKIRDTLRLMGYTSFSITTG